MSSTKVFNLRGYKARTEKGARLLLKTSKFRLELLFLEASRFVPTMHKAKIRSALYTVN